MNTLLNKYDNINLSKMIKENIYHGISGVVRIKSML